MSVKTELVTWKRTTGTQFRFTSWTTWFAGGSTPQPFYEDSLPTWPTKLLAGFNDIKTSVWELNLDSLLLTVAVNVDAFFSVSCNLVQNEAFTKNKTTVIVPSVLEIFALKAEANQKVQLNFQKRFRIINNVSPSLEIFIDEISTEKDKKLFSDLFNEFHALVTLRKIM